jgi:hypothetical protein
MFFENFKKRLTVWKEFREKLETVDNPIHQLIGFWNKAPIKSLTCDPFDETTWLDPWQLIESNDYCEFSKLLAMYYTLALTERFKKSNFKLSIVQDKQQQQLYYVLLVDNIVIGYDYSNPVNFENLPKSLVWQSSYNLNPYNLS